MAALSPPNADLLARLVSDRFDGIPASFVTLCGAAEGDVDALLAEERECVARAVPARRSEFAAGRSLAREALRALGAPPGPLVAAQDRRPVWPTDFVGSISHAGGACIVTVGHTGSAASVGIDLEVDEGLAREVAHLVCRPAELAPMASLDEVAGPRAAKVVFSTKEAVFKCLYPLTGIFLEFHDVEVQLDLEADRFVARVVHPALTQSVHGRLVGRVVRGHGWILSAVSVSPTVASAP
jgi:4'-phosphopantetheinyl transferase EntD